MIKRRCLSNVFTLGKRLQESFPRLVRPLSTKDTTSDSIFLTNISGPQGNSPLILGFLEHLQRHEPSVGFFTPIAPLPFLRNGIPKNVALVKQAFKLPDDPRTMYAMDAAEAGSLLVAGRTNELLERCWNAYSNYKKNKEFVVIEGREIEGVAGLDINAKLASELDSPVLMMLSMYKEEGLSAPEIANRALIAKTHVTKEGADVLGLIVTYVPRDEYALVSAQLKRRLEGSDITFAGAMPYDEVLNASRLNELSAGLGMRLLYGDPDDLDTEVRDLAICASDVAEFMENISKIDHRRHSEGLPPSRPLAFTSRDRADVVLGLVAAHQSGAGPHLSGLVLTDGATARDFPVSTDRILNRLSSHGPILPILESEQPLSQVVQEVANIHPGILPDSTAKIQHAKQQFNHYIDANAIVNRLLVPKPAKLTPASFVHRIYDICKADLQHIVLPEAMDKRVLTAAAEAAQRGLAKVTLLGVPAEVEEQAKKFNVDISHCTILDYMHSPLRETYAEKYADYRKEKGVTKQLALDTLADMNVFGTMMVKEGDADGMVSGACCTTANTIRPGLQLLKTPNMALGGKTLVSSVFFMCLPDKVLAYGDCAVNVEPTAEELAIIAISTADTTAAFGVTPRVAMLSYSTLGSGAGPQVDKVAKATNLVHSLRPDLLVEGPIQYDAAIDPTIAAQKVKGGSEVAGRATVFVFPDLNTGNNTYKAVQQSTGAIAIGPLMQGLAKPVNDLSRGCTVSDIVNTIACTAVQCIGMKRAELAEDGKSGVSVASAKAA